MAVPDMTSFPAELRTERLLLRAFDEADASRLAQLGGAREIADTMISVPHPYTLAQALTNIAAFAQESSAGTGFHFGITLPGDPRKFIGYAALKYIDREHEEAELSFWIDADSAGNGYVTEAAQALIGMAFGPLGLNRICAYHMKRNPASSKVLAKLGFTMEGCLRQRVKKWGRYEDVNIWARLRIDTA